MRQSATHSYAVTPGVGNVFFTPEQLKTIGEVAGVHGRVELNGFHQLIVHTDRQDDLSSQHEQLRRAGLGIYPVGPVVKNLLTCTFCMGERTDGLPDAQKLDQAVAGESVPFPVRVGFAGCASNCAEALTRDIGVVRMAPDHYDIFIGGKPMGNQPLFAQKVAERVSSKQLVPAVSAILGCYKEHAKGRERLWKNVGRLGLEPYRKAAQQACQPQIDET